MYTTIHELVETAQERQLPISELIIEQEVAMSHTSREVIWATMGKNLDVMIAAEKKRRDR